MASLGPHWVKTLLMAVRAASSASELETINASREIVGSSSPSDGPAADDPPPQRHPVRFDDARMDPDALKVLRRLGQAGFEAYLV
ncbi:MAG: hypothetical protein ABI175_10010, partial [Polyangiales bacterium]